MIYPREGPDLHLCDANGDGALEYHMFVTDQPDDEEGNPVPSRLIVPVAVDIENVEFVPPEGEHVEGQAHWHLFVDDVYFLPPDQFDYADVTMASDPSIRHNLKVTLQQNDHLPLECPEGSTCEMEDGVEFLADPSDSPAKPPPEDGPAMQDDDQNCTWEPV